MAIVDIYQTKNREKKYSNSNENMLFGMKTDETIWKPPFLREPLLSTNPPFSEQFFMTSKAPIQEMIPKNPEKSKTDISTCVSPTEQHWKKIVEIPQNCDFFNMSIQNFLGKARIY